MVEAEAPAGTRPLISVIVVNWNGRELLRKCLQSVERHLERVDHETIVVDNGSTDGAPDMVEDEFPRMQLIRNPENLGFGRANNVGMTLARGDFFLLLNSDARLIDDTPVRLVERLRCLPKVGVVGPILRFEDGRLQSSAHRFGSPGLLLVEELLLYKVLPKARVADLLLGGYWDHHQEREVDWITGACMVVRRAVFDMTRGFDPSMFLYGEEVEWCHRIRASGWLVLFSPVGEVRHFGHASADQLLGEQGRIDRCLIAADRLMRKWHGRSGGAAAPLIRIAGAVLKLIVFSFKGLHRRDEHYAREVRRGCKMVLEHYARRVHGQIQSGSRRAVPRT